MKNERKTRVILGDQVRHKQSGILLKVVSIGTFDFMASSDDNEGMTDFILDHDGEGSTWEFAESSLRKKKAIRPLAVLSKREFIAVHVLNGLVARGGEEMERMKKPGADNARSGVIELSVKYADELLEELGRTK